MDSLEQLRDKILLDHQSIRAQLHRVRQQTTADDLSAERLVTEGEILLDMLSTHMDMEDGSLEPSLRTLDAWGEERAAQFRQEHESQRETIRTVRADMHASVVAPRHLASLLTGFCLALETDMEREEESFLNEGLLTDDPVVANNEDG